MDPSENITKNIVSVGGGKGMLQIVVNFCPFLKENDQNKYKSEGAIKSILLFAAHGVEENYFNINKAIAEIELDKIEYKLASDLKCLSLVI